MDKSIWFKPVTVSSINEAVDRFMHRHLGINVLEVGANFLSAEMPVDERTKMPLGLLHGGASCVLAESLGSYGSYFVINPETHKMVGIEINANHLRSLTSGSVTGTARPIHLGRTLHVWGIEIRDPHHELVCVSRLSVGIFERTR